MCNSICYPHPQPHFSHWPTVLTPPSVSLGATPFAIFPSTLFPILKFHDLLCHHLCWRPYHVECTGSLLTSEVKRHRARLVLGWGTAWEDLRVLPASTADGGEGTTGCRGGRGEGRGGGGEGEGEEEEEEEEAEAEAEASASTSPSSSFLLRKNPDFSCLYPSCAPLGGQECQEGVHHVRNVTGVELFCYLSLNSYSGQSSSSPCLSVSVVIRVS